MAETYFDYDRENDSLFIYRKEMMKGSIDIGNFIIDVSHEGKIVGMEIMNASEVLKNLGIENPQDVLESITQASFKAIYKQDSAVVYFIVCSKMQKVVSSVAIPLQMSH